MLILHITLILISTNYISCCVGGKYEKRFLEHESNSVSLYVFSKTHNNNINRCSVLLTKITKKDY